MRSLQHQVSTALQAAGQQAFPDADTDTIIGDSITPSTQAQFGHFQCNAAMRLTKALQTKPGDIATAISAQLSTDLFARVEVAGPGFINLWLQPNLISQYCQQLLQDPYLGVSPQQPPTTVVIDFSSPNIAKEMHVGHLRSTIIGDCIARTFEFIGDNVLRLNHIGDWGTAFGMLIVYLQENHPNILDGSQTTDLSELVHWYKQAKTCFDNDAEFKKRAQLQVVALQSGEARARQAWQVICDVSRRGFQRIYRLLNVELTERGESYYNDMLAETIEALENKNLITVSEGAKCVFLDGFTNRDQEPLPLMVQKSDGGYNYASTDLAALRHRVTVEHADRIIYITDNGQSMHFQMVFAAALQAQFYNPQQTQIDHAGFGLVLGADGKKFKTRSGDTVRLQALLDEAVSRAKAILTSRNPDLNADDLQHAAQVLGIGAVKYADLSCQRLSDYKFSFDRMLQFEGNTAAFILYSYVRVRSIQRKINTTIENIPPDTLTLTHPSEIDLGLHLTSFSDTIEKLANHLTPHYLTDFLFTTAQKFNAFFRDCHVADSPEQDSRLLLCELTARIIKKGLSLLGINTLEKM